MRLPIVAAASAAAWLCSTLMASAQGADSTTRRSRDSSRVAAPVVVSAARIPLAMDKAPRTVDVITASDLERLPVRSFQEALATIPGIDVRTSGPFGGQADVSMRGGGFEQTAVLIDGMRMNDMQTGHHSINMPMTLDDIDRIEIVKGGASRLFGSSAMDGAINVIPKRGGPARVSAAVMAGDFGMEDMRIGGAATTGPVSHRISTQRLHTDNYRPSSELNVHSLFYSAALDASATQVTLDAGVTDKAFGAGNFYNFPIPNAFEHTVTWFGGLTSRTAFDWGDITGRVFYRIGSDEFKSNRRNATAVPNLHRTDQLTGQVAGRVKSGLGWTSLVVEAGSDVMESSALGTRDRRRGSVSLDQSIDVADDVFVGVGAGLLAFSDRNPGIVGGVDASWRYQPGSRLYANVNRNMRIPTYTELYYRQGRAGGGFLLVGDSTVQPEVSITAEVGVSHTMGIVAVEASAYRRMAENLIDYAFGNDSLPWRTSNIGTVNINGLEVGVRANLAREWEASPISFVRVGVNWQDVRSSAPVPTRYVATNLRWQGVLETTWALPLDIEGTFMVRLVERVNNPKTNVIGDLRLWHRFGTMLRAVAEVSNLWNTDYVEAGLVPMPPRWFRIGLDFGLNVGAN